MLLSVKLTFGQVSDNFADGNIHTDPTWIGDIQQFMVNGSKQLQTTLSANSQSVMISTSSQLALNVQWDFFIQLNFDPSTSNQAKIYLMSDQADLNGPLNGYFIQIGENGSADSYDLYRQTGTVAVKVIDGATKLRSDVNKLIARVRVTRSTLGEWKLYTDINGGNNYNLEGSATDIVHRFTDWFGVQCKYTATRSNGFIFDDFAITALSPDVTPPELLSAKVRDEHTIEAVFSERLQSLSALMAQAYSLTVLGNPVQVLATAQPDVYRLTFAAVLPSGDHELTVTGVKDLKGNEIGLKRTAQFFYLQPYELKIGDLLISEILVNPKTGGVDFVEIYNHTDQVIDLKGLRLANADASGLPANIKTISTVSVYMPAKSYWVLTSDPSLVKQHYVAKFPHQFVQMAMPAYNNDKGTVFLLDAAKELEHVSYTDQLHHALLRNVDGVSLERIDLEKPADAPGNFLSAALVLGGATPTYRNSQMEQPLVNNTVSLANKVFSPDGDGFEDELKIDYKFANSGNLATVNIYTEKGILVRRLKQNTSIATEGSFFWDGKNDAGQSSGVGIYIIRFETFALNGKAESYKKIGVLAAKLN
ncbi:MAG: lamin tail domain-containing protein [Pedobacter sp.]|nr:lamin tail domain-containing protein [Pedobacter sp.]